MRETSNAVRMFFSDFQIDAAAAEMIIVVKNLPATKLFDLEKCVDSF